MIEVQDYHHELKSPVRRINFKRQVMVSLVFLSITIGSQIWIKPFNQNLFVDINGYSQYIAPSIWCVLTLMGDTSILWPMILPMMRHSPKAIFAAILAIPVGGLMSVLLKHAFGAPRPADLKASLDFTLLGPVLTSNSFPSGHTITAFAAASAIVMTLDFQNKNKQNTVIWLIILFAFLIGLSRIMVGAHWPYDVLAGACVGWVGGLSGLKLAAQSEKYWQKQIVQKIKLVILWLVSLYNLFRVIDYAQGIAAVWISFIFATSGVILYFRPWNQEDAFEK